MHDTKFSLTKPSSIEVENEKYETIVKKNSSEMAFLLPNKRGDVKLAVTKIEGIVAVVADVDLPAGTNLIIPNNRAAGVPNINFKRRHPIHGTGKILIYYILVHKLQFIKIKGISVDLNSDKMQSAVPIKKIKKEATQVSAKKRKSKSKH